MAVSIGVVAGLAAALGWGVSDFVAKLAVGRLGKHGDLKALFWARLAGLAVMLAGLLLTGFDAWGILPWLPVLLLLGAIDFAGSYSFYRALSKGEVSVVTPIALSFAALTAAIGVVFLSEPFIGTRALGVGLVTLGVALASSDLLSKRKADRKIVAGVPEAVFTLLCWGVMWALASYWSYGIGWILPMLAMRGVTVLGCAALGRMQRFPFAAATVPLVVLAGVAGVLDAASGSITMWALGSEMVSVVVPITAAAPAVTVMLAVFLLKEKLGWHQGVGILSIILGVIALSL